MSSLVKAQVEGFRCVRGWRGRPGDAKATGDSRDQLGIIYAHKWLLSWSRGLFWLKRDLETTICNLRYCRLKLFVYGWLIPMLISLVLKKSTKHSSNLSKQKTSTIRITWRLFFVCSSCLFTFSLSRAHAYHAMHNSVIGFHYLPFFVEDLCKHAASKFFDEINIFREKMSLKRRCKIDRISWYYWICFE